MRLKRFLSYLPELEIRGSKETEITGICNDSRLIAPGNLFIAKKGSLHHGAQFVKEAIAHGAQAVLSDMYDPFLQIVQCIHPHVDVVEAKLAAIYYQNPSRELKVIGITGTNGKTTCSFLVKHLLDQLEMPCGLMGGVEWIVGEHHFPAIRTTADVVTNHKMLKEMVEAGCKASVFEVTSHGLQQNRVGEIDFDVAVFTNLSQDHLDYHLDMPSYHMAKEKLFTSLSKEKWAVLNTDDPWTMKTEAQVLTYGITKKADLMAKDIKLSGKKTYFTASYLGKEVACSSHLLGTFNIYNLLAALGVGLALGFSLEACASILKNFKKSFGRLERIKNCLDLNIFVDYACNDVALQNVLETLRSLTSGKLIAVFGCGGDRDKSKREKMGKAVYQLADQAIITNDNPRGEDPEKIALEVLKGFGLNANVSVELNRELAIRKAIFLANLEDTVLIAGKGHEKEQVFARQVLPFDEEKIIQNLCKEREVQCGFC